MTTTPRPRPLAILGALLLLAGCGGGPGGVADILVVARVDVAPTPGPLTVGQTVQLTATPRTSSGIVVPNRTIAWSSSNPATATVSGTGLVTAVAAAAAPVVISARVDGVTGSVSILIAEVPVARVTVTPSTASVFIGENTQLQAQAFDADNNPLSRALLWASSASAVASVGTTGLVTGVTQGNATITASAGGQSGSAAVTVRPRPATRLGFLVQPGSTPAGTAITPPVQVAVRDDIGATVPGATHSITVALGANPSGGTLSGQQTVSAVNGVAIFSGLRIDKAGTSYSLSASASGLTTAQSLLFSVLAGAAGGLRIDAEPSPNATNGVPFPAQPVVQLVDAGNNPVASVMSVTVTATGPGALLGGTTTLSTNAAGQAAFTDLQLTGIVGDYQLTFSAAGVTGVTSGTITLGPGPATQLLLTTPPTASPQSGVPFPTQPVVRLADMTGNVVSQAGVSVVAARTSGTATLSGTLSATTNATGAATWTDLRLTGTAGPHVLTFSTAGLTSVSTGTLTLTAGPASSLVITTQPPATATSGAAFTSSTVVALRDANNNPLLQAGVPLTATIATGAGGTLGGTTTVTTLANGTATFSNLTLTGTSGGYTLQFAGPGLTSVISTTITLSAGSGSKIGITTQPPGTVTNGVIFSQAPVVQLLDASNNPVSQSGVSVTVSILTGSGTLSGTQIRSTDGAGSAAFPGLAITSPSAGAHTLLFAAPGFVAVQSSAITLVAGAAASVSANTPLNPSATAGTPVSPAPSVKVTDVGGIPVTAVNVTFTASAGSTLSPASPATVATNASGDAGVTSWTLSATAGANTLTASAGAAGSVVFTGTGTAGPPASVTANSSISQSATAGTAVGSPPSVLVTDAGANPVAGVNVTFSVTTGGGSISPAGGTVTTNASGIATLTSWTLGPAAGVNNNSVTISLAGLPDVVFTATATVGPPATIAGSSAPPGSAPAGSSVTPPEVIVTDATGNPVSGVSVTFTITAGAGSIAPASPAVVLTDGFGLAALTDWTLDVTPGTNTVEATSGTLSGSPVVFTVTGTGGAATTMAANSTPPASAPVGTSVTAPSVLVTDAVGNPVAGVNVDFAITAGDGSTAPASPVTVATNGSGVAALTTWTLGTTAGANTVTATAAGLAGSPVTFSVTGTAGAATTIAASSNPPGSAPAGSTVTPPSVLVTDANNNPVSGVDVTFTITAGAGSITPASPATITTNASGIAALTDWTLDAAAGDNTVEAASGTLTGSPVVFTVTGTIASATSLTSNSSTTQSATAGTAVGAPPSVLARDSGNNPVAGVDVTFSVTGGGGSIVPGGGIVTTDASGIATLTSWTLGTTAGTNNNTVSAMLGTLGPVVFTASATAGPATTIAASSTPPASAPAGSSVTPPAVLVTDAFGNPVAGVDVTFAITVGAGSITPASPATVTTNASGIAALTNWTLDATAGTNTVEATAGLTGSPVSFTVTGT